MKDSVKLIPQFNENGIACYKVLDEAFVNDYYIVSEASSRRLLNTPEMVGYDVYKSLVPATGKMIDYFKDHIHKANILTILRGALNYPLEEACYRENVPVHDISFLSSERTFDENGDINGLVIKYNKLAIVDQSTLMIGDIIATGATLKHCFKYVLDAYKAHKASLKNVIIFTIGAPDGITLLEDFTKEIRSFWPDFEGFMTVYYEGIFSLYQDKGVSGINHADIDLYWKDGLVSPEFRKQTLATRDPLFEKCVIYDGGARRYEISLHIAEVLEFWEGLLERKDKIDKNDLLAEKLGHDIPISYEEWVHIAHYEAIDPAISRTLYDQECQYINNLENVSLETICKDRIRKITNTLKNYMY